MEAKVEDGEVKGAGRPATLGDTATTAAAGATAARARMGGSEPRKGWTAPDTMAADTEEDASKMRTNFVHSKNVQSLCIFCKRQYIVHKVK